MRKGRRPRCRAYARTTGLPCRRKVVEGRKRCPNHGGLSTGVGRRPVGGALQPRRGVLSMAFRLIGALAGSSKPRRRARAGDHQGAGAAGDEGQERGNAVAAGRELLDRAYGKPPQALVGDPKNPLAAQFAVVGRTIDAPPDETREEWFARRYRELGIDPPAAAVSTNGRDQS